MDAARLVRLLVPAQPFAPALGVTFLLPAPSVQWGALFIDEPAGRHAALVRGFRPAALQRGARSCP